MNIVYITDNCVNPTLGGIDRITSVMAETLHKKYGYTCYSVFAREKNEWPDRDNVFAAIHKWESKEAFIAFILQIGACVIVLQSPCTIAKEVLEAKALLPHVRLVNVFHGTPGFEAVPLDWSVVRYRLLHNIDRKWTFKQSVIQIGMALCPRLMTRMLRKKYARPYGVADKMVVLAQGIIDQYQTVAPGEREKFIVIPNILSFDDVDHLPQMKDNKEVLIVSRLDDWHKRILEAIKIWDLVQRKGGCEEWCLRIVGDGIDRPFYEEYVRKHAIPNIRFEGRQNSLAYYRKARLFMMTSACEGFPMTLIESQQCGCVPVVYDTFASLTDVVTDRRNGFVVKEGDQESFAARLMQLMNDEGLREQMAKNGYQDCQRYTSHKVAEQWNNLLNELANQK